MVAEDPTVVLVEANRQVRRCQAPHYSVQGYHDIYHPRLLLFAPAVKKQCPLAQSFTFHRHGSQQNVERARE